MSAPWICGGEGKPVPSPSPDPTKNNITGYMGLPISGNSDVDLSNAGSCLAFINVDPTDPSGWGTSANFSAYQCKAPLQFIVFLAALKKFQLTPGLPSSGPAVTVDRSNPTVGINYTMQQVMFDTFGLIFANTSDPMGGGGNAAWQVNVFSSSGASVQFMNDFYHQMTYTEFDPATGNYSLDPRVLASGGRAAGSLNAFGYSVPIFCDDSTSTPFITPSLDVVTPW